MHAPIDFYFAFGSPPGYFASQRIDAIALKHRRTTTWRPLDIRALFAEEEIRPTVLYPRKGPYHHRDWARTARLHDIPFNGPPDGASSPSRIGALLFYWIAETLGDAAARAFAEVAMHAYFVDGRPTGEPEVMAGIAAALGADETEAAAVLDDAAWQARLAAETEAAARAGVWGSPHVVVDGEPFWGHDRLEQVDLWLERGGW